MHPTTNDDTLLSSSVFPPMHTEIDDFTDPWCTPDVVLMLHGIAEEACIWRPWSPHFSRRYRVVRVDLRGFGSSPALPLGRSFTISDWADDIAALVAQLGSRRVHLIGTKLGALVAFELAQRQPEWLASMTLAGMLASPSGSLGAWVGDWIACVERGGVVEWARVTMPGRMGDNLSPAAMDWWIALMGRAPAPTVLNAFRLLPEIHEPAGPERVACPTLFIAAGGAGFRSGTYDQRPAPEDLKRLQRRVPGAELALIEANSYHIAATHPDDCARTARGFIDNVGAGAPAASSSLENLAGDL